MTTAPPGRLEPLDGLRGVAATIVVLHHLTLMTPAIGAALWPSEASAAATVAERALVSPVHLVLASGRESVLLFFVLSGIVLTLPALRQGFSWLVYYPRRLIRLVLPVLGSVALATLLVLAVPRYSVPGREHEWLFSDNSLHFSVADLGDTLNIFGGLQPLNNPLWSLGWEVIFSLLLPLGVLVAMAVRRWPPLGAAVVLLCLVGSTIASVAGLPAGVYLPVFLVGCVLAAVLPTLLRHLSGLGTAVLSLMFALCLALIAVPWVFAASDGEVHDLAPGFVVLGGLGLVCLALTLPWWRAFLTVPVVRWLGRISFSLYLVHVPVIVTLAFLVGPARWYLYVPLGVLASMLVASGFYYAVERPTHLLARRVGQWIAAGGQRG